MTQFINPSKTVHLILISVYPIITKNYKLVLFLLEQISIAENKNEWTFEDLSQEIKALYKPAYSTLIETLGKILENLFEFESFFKSLQQLLDKEESDISINSPAGIFLRQSLLEINQMDMVAMSRFFTSTRAYVTGTNAKPSLSTALHDMDSYFDKLIDKKIVNENPKELFQISRHVDHYWPQESKHLFAHYSNYLNCNEYEAAHEYLQRYFETKSNSENPEKNHAYLLLFHAIYLAHFEKNPEAFHVIQEALPIARDCQDNECLFYLQSWLEILGHGPSHSSTNSISDLNQGKILSVLLQKRAEKTTDSRKALTFLFKSIFSSLPDLSPFNALANTLYTFGDSHLSLLLLTPLNNPGYIKDQREEASIISTVLTLAQINFDQGKHVESFELLNKAHSILPHHSPFHAQLSLLKNEFILQHALRKKQLNKAKELISVLHQQGTVKPIWQVRFDIESGEYSNAYSLISRQSLNSESKKTTWHSLLSELYTTSDSLDVSLSSLPLLLSNIARSESLNQQHDQLLLKLARILLILSRPLYALQIIQNILARIINFGNLELQSNALLLYGECLVANATDISALKIALNVIHIAEKGIFLILDNVGFNELGYKKLACHDKLLLVAYLCANIYNELGNISERDKYSQLYFEY